MCVASGGERRLITQVFHPQYIAIREPLASVASGSGEWRTLPAADYGITRSFFAALSYLMGPLNHAARVTVPGRMRLGEDGMGSRLRQNSSYDLVASCALCLIELFIRLANQFDRR